MKRREVKGAKKKYVRNSHKISKTSVPNLENHDLLPVIATFNLPHSFSVYLFFFFIFQPQVPFSFWSIISVSIFPRHYIDRKSIVKRFFVILFSFYIPSWLAMSSMKTISHKASIHYNIKFIYFTGSSWKIGEQSIILNFSYDSSSFQGVLYR